MNDEATDRRQLLLGGIVDTFAAIELRAQVLLAGFALQEIVGEVLAADLTFQAIAQKLTFLSKLPGLGRAGEELGSSTFNGSATTRASRLTQLGLDEHVQLTGPRQLSIALSSSASAKSFFSCAFSLRSSRSSLASSAFMPPYWLRQRCQVDSVISR